MTNLKHVGAALEKNGIGVITVKNKDSVRNAVEDLLTLNAEVMQMSSVSLEETGVSALINESGKFKSVKSILYGAEETGLSAKDKTRLASVPDFAVGSVHAVTEAGQLVIASNTGSQLPAYVYGPGKVIFVVGIQKVVKTLEDAIKRIYDYVLPLESERARKAYGVSGSNVSKLLIINKEVIPGRITVIFVEEELGY